jgi:pyrroline-5-carboxylate reductase
MHDPRAIATDKHAMTTKTLEKIGGLALVGAGKMGGAMLDGWLALGLNPRSVSIFDPKPSPEIEALTTKGIALNPAKDAAGKPGVVILAVKPQIAPDAMPSVAALVGGETLVISIMAGKTMSFLQAALPNAAIVRAMPNTPAAIGRGIAELVPNAKVTPAQRQTATDLLSATGKIEWIDDEALIDAVTAVSGSGPAYVFLLAEALAQAGIAAGLPKALAEKLARETVAGAGELLYRSPLDPATLRKNVTSPAGTTAAALEILMGPGGFDALMTKAVAAAAKRSKELAG